VLLEQRRVAQQGSELEARQALPRVLQEDVLQRARPVSQLREQHLLADVPQPERLAASAQPLPLHPSLLFPPWRRVPPALPLPQRPE
jgi:hypothetical protein